MLWPRGHRGTIGALAVRRRTRHRVGRHRGSASRSRSQIPPPISAATRAELVAALTQLSRAIRVPQPGGLRQAASQAQRMLDQQPAPPPADDAGAGRRAPPCPGDNQRGQSDCRSPGIGRGRRCRRTRRRHPRRTDDADAAAGEPRGAAVCGRPPGKPSRWPSPRRWPSSSASWCRPPAGIGR